MRRIDENNKVRKPNNVLLSAAGKFKREAKKNIMTAVMAAFGFLIALVWRDAIKESVNDIVKIFNVEGSGVAIMYITAILTTVICVIGILIFSRWGEKKE